ncbi:MAG: hypothetical protein GKR97_00095 [Rhizobiaceae bacterium]|nr:hypothetical protein [Rhizobiaceae bacterium]
MRPILATTLASFLIICHAAVAQAQDLPPRSLFDAMLNAHNSTGLVKFRNFNGRQIIYFTAAQVLHCRLKEIRYSINSEALDQRVELVKCNKATPFSMGESDVVENRIYKTMPLGTAQWAAVQVVWEDGEESQIQKVNVCENVGESTCGIVE